MVLQDLPHVINDIHDLDPRIESMAHDMFLSQPVEGDQSLIFSS